MREMFNLIIEKMNLFNTICAFASTIFTTIIWLNTKKKQKRRDILFIAITTLTAFIIPILFLINTYRLPSLNWMYWICVIISICFIFAYLFNLIFLLYFKNKMDKDFKGIKMFDND
jgi:hypothetical protein